jgi:hypothetical protein
MEIVGVMVFSFTCRLFRCYAAASADAAIAGVQRSFLIAESGLSVHRRLAG